MDVGEPPHARGLMGLYTEQGVVTRRDRSPDEIINEIREAATQRHTALLADPPTDGTGRPTRIFGGISWDWERLLRNRPLDVWMHEQDVRRALDLPGNLDSAPPSTPPITSPRASASWSASGSVRRPAPPWCWRWRAARRTPSRSATNGRARQVAPPADPTTRIGLDREDFIVAAGGRRTPVSVRIEGDEDLGRTALGVVRGDPVTGDVTGDRRLAAGRHPATRAAARSWSPAAPAASATTPRSSWPGAAPAWCSPAARPSKIDATDDDHPPRGARRRARAGGASTSPTSTRFAGPPPPPRGSARSTCWSTTPA